MQEFIYNFHFLRPWWLILLIIPFILYFSYNNRLHTTSSWEKVCDKNLLNFLLIKGSSLQRRVITYLSIVGFFFAVLAVSGPSWIKREVDSMSSLNPLMICLNLSSDMMEQDITPNRLARAKYAISDLLTGIHQMSSGLIVYSGEPFLITPITEDNKIISNLLSSIDFNIMPENGDRLDRALLLAQESLKNSGWNYGNIIIFAADVGQEFANTLQIAKTIGAEGYSVYVVNTSAEFNSKLQKIAEQGNGIYFNITDINQLINHISKEHSSKLQNSNNKISQWLDYGYYLVFIPLLCCLYMFRKGILVILVMLLVSTQAYAGFFINSNQEGVKAFKQGDYKTAVEHFTDNNWQGSSNYRLGNYEQAYKNFSHSKDITALYNQGNALAKMGKIEEAIKRYEAVLQQDANHEDAKFNLEYLKQQQQNQSQSSGNKDEENKDQSQNTQQSSSSQNSDKSQENGENTQNQADNQQTKDNSQSQTPNNAEQDNSNPDMSANQQQKQIGEQQEQNNNKAEKSGSALQNNNGENTYNEEVQARELQYREIPEDAGGLLRAFIAKEYAKKRYVKDK